MITIKTGRFDVLETKTLLIPGLGETKITINHGIEEISFIFDFRIDDKSEQQLNYELVDDQQLRIVLINWGGPFPTTPIEPVPVGTIGNRELFILFSAAKAGDKAEIRQLTFTALLGEVANG
ncbi:MAG: DUF6864 domain-containing function [Lysobacterales bacterium]